MGVVIGLAFIVGLAIVWTLWEKLLSTLFDELDSGVRGLGRKLKKRDPGSSKFVRSDPAEPNSDGPGTD